MSKKKPHQISIGNIILSLVALFFFAFAVYMIHHQLAQYTATQIFHAVFSVPTQNFLLAVLAVIGSYIVLSFYDKLALTYIGKKLPPGKWLFAGGAAFAVSNNAGHAFISGTAIRYHLYKRWGFKISDILRMVAFSSVTYLVGCFCLFIIGYFLAPAKTLGAVSKPITLGVLTISIAGLTAYLLGTRLIKRKIKIKNVSVGFPTTKMGLAQIAVGSLDVLFASLVLFAVLNHAIDISFTAFIGLFLIAQVIGTFSQVPGGAGVFEAIFFYVTADTDEKKIPLIAALIAYRVLYYFLPLMVAILAMGIYEIKERISKRHKNRRFDRKA